MSVLHFSASHRAQHWLDLYYEAFPKDRQAYKWLIYGIYILEFVQTMLVTHDAFAMFGYGFGDVQAVTDIHFNWLTVPIMSGIGKSSVNNQQSMN
jgi:hypothetical protein